MANTKKTQYDSMSDFQKQLNQRCFDDPGFRKHLMADPNGTIAEELGVPKEKLKEIEIRVHENNEKVWNFNVLSDELGDKMLEQVSGGLLIEAIGVGLLTALIVQAATR